MEFISLMNIGRIIKETDTSIYVIVSWHFVDGCSCEWITKRLKER